MPLAGFELAVPASERPQTHGLDRAATGVRCYSNSNRVVVVVVVVVVVIIILIMDINIHIAG